MSRFECRVIESANNMTNGNYFQLTGQDWPNKVGPDIDAAECGSDPLWQSEFA